MNYFVTVYKYTKVKYFTTVNAESSKEAEVDALLHASSAPREYDLLDPTNSSIIIEESEEPWEIEEVISEEAEDEENDPW